MITRLKFNYPYILFAALALFRLWNLDSIPVFGDETVTLSFAEKSLHNPSELLGSLTFGVMPMVGWINSFFEIFLGKFINLLTLGRVISVLADLGSAFLIYKIASQLFNKTQAIISTVIYLLIPLNFLNSRMVLLEPVTNLFIVLALYFEAKLINSVNKQTLLTLVLISLFLTLSFFTKPVAVVSFIGVLSLPLFLKKPSKTTLPKIFLPSLLSGLLIILLYLPISHYFSRYVTDNHQLSFAMHHFKLNLWRTIWWLRTYLTLPLILLAGVSLLVGLSKKDFKVIWLLIWIASLIILSALFSLNFYPRHLYLLAVPFSILSAYLFSAIKQINLVAVVLAILLIPAIYFDYQIITSPSTAPLALEDKQQLFEDWSSGLCSKEISQEINNLSQSSPINVVVEDEPSKSWALSHLFNIGQATIIPSYQQLIDHFPESNLLMAHTPTYLLLDKNQVAPADWPVSKVYSCQKGPNRVVTLYRLNSPQ